MSEKLDFNYENHNKETDTCFSLKSRMSDDNKLALEIDFYGDRDNMIMSFLTLIATDEVARDVIFDIMNQIVINRMVTEITGEDGESEEQTKPEDENNSSGESLSS